MFDDPEIDKLIIYALIGICAVLFLAVIFLAVKKNTYYIDEDGEEIIPKNARVKKVSANKKKKPVIVEDYDDDDDEEDDIVPVPVAAPVVEETIVQPLEEIKEVSEAPEPVAEPAPVRTPVAAEPVGMLVAVKVAGNVTEHMVDAFPCLIGREATSCNLTISEPAVSRRHARFVKEGKAFYIEDVSEHNGTYLNGSKLAPLGSGRLSEGDRVNLGRAEVRIKKFIY